jgi:WD40 repeat protein
MYTLNSYFSAHFAFFHSCVCSLSLSLSLSFAKVGILRKKNVCTYLIDRATYAHFHSDLMVSMDTREGGGGRGRGGRGGRGGFYNSYSNNNASYSSGNPSWNYNSNTGNQPYYGNTNSNSTSGGGRWGGRGRGRGRGGRGGYQGQANAAPDVEFVSDMRGHRKKVTCMCVDYDRQQLLTGSHDQTVRVWNCQTGECLFVNEVGGEVDCMLVEGGFLFVGLKTSHGQGQIKVWNLNDPSATHHTLEGHIGQVTALAVANGMVFSGGQDKTIRVWKVGQSGGFECAAVLDQQSSDGHRSSVSSMCVAGGILFSGDTGGTIKVWDLDAGSIKQTLIKAHRNAQYPAITSLLIWEGHLMSGSLDGEIKIWEPATDGKNMVNPASIYVYPENNQSGGGSGGRGRGRGYRQPGNNGVLALCGVADLEGKAVLMVSYNTEHCIKMFELPTFGDRGTLTHVNNPRAMACHPHAQLLFAGDETGKVKCWRWKKA